MKGANRILSVFLLVIMLCTFFVFPASAANPTVSPRDQWRFSVGSNGKDAAGADIVNSQDGSVIMAIPISASPGSEIDLSFSVGPYPGTLSSDRYIFVFLGYLTSNSFDCSDQILINQNTTFTHGGDYRVVKDGLKIPDSYHQPCIVIITNHSGNLYLWGFEIYDVSTDKGVLNSIKEGFSKLWEWLQGIWDSIKEIPTKIGQFITNLGDRISTFFSNLTNSIKGFFTDLWDKIWNGDGSVPPFDNNNKFAQVIEKLNEWTAKIKKFSGSVDSSADTVTGYLQSGTSFLNSAMGAFPAALTAVLGFALVFIVVRKVVGR